MPSYLGYCLNQKSVMALIDKTKVLTTGTDMLSEQTEQIQVRRLLGAV